MRFSDPQSLRLECLKLAVQRSDCADGVVKLAREMLDFINEGDQRGPEPTRLPVPPRPIRPADARAFVAEGRAL